MGLIKITADMTDAERTAVLNTNLQYLQLSNRLRKYPIGMIVAFDTDIDPNELYGGTWEQLDNETAYVIETGQSGIWNYRKWSDGTAECWGSATAAIDDPSATTNGAIYKSAEMSVALPSGLFIANGSVNVDTTDKYSWVGNSFMQGNGANVRYSVFRGGEYHTSFNTQIDIHACGKWKSGTNNTPMRIWRKTGHGIGEDPTLTEYEAMMREMNEAISTSRAEDKKLYNNLYANALRGTATGSAIRLTDVSPNEHTVGVMIRNRNLIPYPYAETTKTINGITFTVNADGSINVTGTSTATSTTVFFLVSTSKPLNLDKGKQYTLSGFTGEDENCGLSIQATNYTVSASSNKNTLSKTFTANFGTWYMWIHVNAGAAVDTTFYPQLELGSAATAYTPYISDLTSVNVTACGKNLMPYPYSVSGTVIQNGGTFVINDDGTITASGTPTAYAGFALVQTSPISVDKSKKYTLSIGANAVNVYLTLFLYDKDKTQLTAIYAAPSSSKTFDLKDYPTATLWNISASRNNSNVEMSGTVYPQLELGSTATAYEPYQAPTVYTPTADGTVEDVTSISPNMTLMTDTAGITIDCEYNRDINKAFAELQQAVISSGGNI